jgi:hypothetical protein
MTLLQQGKFHGDDGCVRWWTVARCASTSEARRLLVQKSLTFARILDADTGRIIEERRDEKAEDSHA